MISNEEIIKAVKATIDHNNGELKKQLGEVKDDPQKAALIRASFDEVIDGHFNMLKAFVFIELVESNNLDLSHVIDLMDEHISILDKQLTESNNEAVEKRINYNKSIWETAKKKLNGYLELLNPVE